MGGKAAQNLAERLWSIESAENIAPLVEAMAK
jgi:hypothetical protein